MGRRPKFSLRQRRIQFEAALVGGCSVGSRHRPGLGAVLQPEHRRRRGDQPVDQGRHRRPDRRRAGRYRSLAPRLDRIGARSECGKPVVRSQVLPVPSGEKGGSADSAIAAQGIDAAGADATLDLAVTEGDLSALTGDTVAVSEDGAFTLGAEVGQRVDLYLGDGTLVHPMVVAKYGRGLGFGDVTMPIETLRQHSTDALIDTVLVAAEPGRSAEVQQSLRSFPSIAAMNQDQFGAAGEDQRRMQSWVSILAVLVLLGYLAVAVVNTLVAATAERSREFALLQLVGSRTRQVRAMMRIESLMVVGIAVVVGSLIALPPLMGIAVAVSGQPIPAISPAIYGSIVAVTAVQGFVSIAIPTRAALRKNPMDGVRNH